MVGVGQQVLVVVAETQPRDVAVALSKPHQRPRWVAPERGQP